MTMLGYTPPKLNATRAVAVFGVFLLIFLWAGIFINLNAVRSRMLSDAAADTANLARAFDEHIQRTIAGLDQTLLYLKAEYEADPSRFNLNKSAANAVILKRVSVQIARIGADGILADSNVAGFKAVDLSDREHFKVHVNGGDKLYVSKPVLGRASGKWSVQLTRRLEDAGGNFAGVLVISLDPLYLGQFYGSINVGADGAIALIGHDGIIRAASYGSGLLGQKLPDGKIFEALLSKKAVSVEDVGPLDDETRIISIRSLPDLPLSVAVGRSRHEILNVFDHTRLLHIAGGAVVTAVLLTALAILYRMVRAQEATTRDLSVKKAELQAGRMRLRRYVSDLERIAEVAAHDLQEPLRRMVAYAQLLSSHAGSALDDEGRGYVAHVVQGAQRMRDLIKDLEAFVAVDSTPTNDAIASASLAAGIAVDRLEDKIRSAGAMVAVEALPQVMADDKALTEIFTQLLDNAVTYTVHGRKPIVNIGWHSENKLAVFTIRDNGSGIETRDRIRLFEVFHRLNAVEYNGGTGIGLAIVRRMVEHMGGRVAVDSTPGQGSMFSFSLPLSAADLLVREAKAA